ncbi:DUF4097 family beta strand repeat-containing protein [Aquimarina algicola]|uniref:DUF4097 domain-containing protein n=1 Tax=Aquimarina algicola TaxID=2589995 RepID=A0A504JLK9_9FLAO|nr:DUF4097 family beta strand repeat-containing protein [Aquimarina algicola]TPN87639.1 DUF4097 domain-containing protein [Aquimarina algicola]
MNRITITIIVFIIATLNGISQDYTHNLQGVKKVKISSATDINIRTHTKKELLIKSEENGQIPEKAKGLKAIFPGGDDNTGYGINVIKEGEILILKNLKNMHSEEMDIYLPKDINITVENPSIGDLNINGFTSEIEVKSNVGEIKIHNVTGPIVAKSSAGDIEVIFDKINQSSPISLITSSGDVDVSLPSSTPANLSLKASMGEIYTDFDLKIPSGKDNMQVVGGSRSIDTKINSGGVNISLRCSVGNIYLRKK